jgi:hypothetical protein
MTQLQATTPVKEETTKLERHPFKADEPESEDEDDNPGEEDEDDFGPEAVKKMFGDLGLAERDAMRGSDLRDMPEVKGEDLGPCGSVAVRTTSLFLRGPR